MKNLIARLRSAISHPVIRRVWRIVRWPCWSILAALILAVILWTILNVAGTSRLNGAIDSLHRAGYATALYELAPPAVPPDQNAAPLYEAAFLILQSGGTPYDWRSVDAGDTLPEEAEKKRLQAWMDSNAAAIGEAFALVTRARSRPRCRFDHDYHRPYAGSRLDLRSVLRMAKCLRVRAESFVRQGRTEDARSAVRDLFALAEAFKDDPLLLFLCGMVGQIGLDTIDACVSGATPAADLRAWQELIPPPERFGEAAELAVRTAIASQAWFSLQCTDSGRSSLLVGGDGDFAWILVPFAKLDWGGQLSDAPRIVEVCRKPYAEAWDRIETEKAGMRAREGLFHPGDAQLWPTAAVDYSWQTTLQARLAVTRAGLGHELAFQVKGRYPDTVDVLDPLTGKPLLCDRGQNRIAGLKGSWTLRHRP